MIGFVVVVVVVVVVAAVVRGIEGESERERERGGGGGERRRVWKNDLPFSLSIYFFLHCSLHPYSSLAPCL